MLETLHEGPGITLGRWRCACPDPDWSRPEHVRVHELVVPVQGQFVRRRNGREAAANANTALLANPGDSYCIRHPEGLADVCVVVLFDRLGMEDLARTTERMPGGRDPDFSRDTVAVAPRTFLRLRLLLDRLRGDTADSLPIDEALARIASDVVEAIPVGEGRAPDPAGTRSRHERAVRKAEEYLAACFREPITLARVAAKAAYSPFHFARIFRVCTGMSVHRYLTQLRLRAALDALLEGQEDLNALAHGLGFSSHSHFGEAFRREYGCTPSSVRDDRSITGVAPPDSERSTGSP